MFERHRRFNSNRYISFAHNRKLIDISSINHLDYIGEVSFEKNSKLRDYSVLADNQNIHNLFISDLDDLKFIQSMKSLLSFRFWNCKTATYLLCWEIPY